MSLNRCVALAVVLCIFCSQAFPARVLLLGDSITKGGISNGLLFKPWRVWFKTISDSAGTPYEYIGLLNGWQDPVLSWAHSNQGTCTNPVAYNLPLHGAECGWSTGQVKLWFDASVPDLKRAPPDIVIIATGTNNFGVLGQSSAVAIAETQSFVEDVSGVFPNADIYVGQLIPRTDYWAIAAAEYNRLLAVMASKCVAKKMKVNILDWSNAIEASDLLDGLHPTDAGARKLALRAFSVLQKPKPYPYWLANTNIPLGL